MDRTDRLFRFEYPGRLIVLGRTPSSRAAAVYAITGRSPSSQARRLARRDGGIWVEPTDEAVLKTGNVDLLVYPAVLFAGREAAVSNGRQTADVARALAAGRSPVATLAEALADWTFEPDAPIFTPRISGCLSARGAALSIVRRGPAEGTPLRSYYEVPAPAGLGFLLSTYAGPNADPLPIFAGDPREVPIPADGAGAIAAAVYDSLGPGPSGGKDVRVAVAALVFPEDEAAEPDIAVINRHERT